MPDYNYVSTLREHLRQVYQGFHKKIVELEEIRYFEDKVKLESSENPSGVEFHIGLSAELVENVKAALTADTPAPIGTAKRRGDDAESNKEKREKFHTEWFKSQMYPVPTLNELCDAFLGLGAGIAKSYYAPWPPGERKKKGSESDEEYLDRTRGLKRYWGVPFGITTVHPLSFLGRFGPGGRLTEVIEHSWKYKMDAEGLFERNSPDAMALMSSTGQPDSWERPMPAGTDTSIMSLVDEYYNINDYQIWLDGNLGYDARARRRKPPVCYHVVSGRTSSSQDPDKWAMSIAEPLRPNEPLLNRAITRMIEATDLMVRRRLALQLPEGSIMPTTMVDGVPTTLSINLKGDSIEPLPVGSQIQDPFEGAYHAYEVMPMLEFLIGLMAQHGVAPIFKGQPPGAAGSGYRDNSLYMMAQAQFKYILLNYQACLSQIIRWNEWCIVNCCKQEVWCGEYSLTPSDIVDWPVSWDVVVKPSLPQNMIANGEFYSRMHAQGIVTADYVREQGLGIEQPSDMAHMVLLEQVIEAVKPILVQDVVQGVLRQQQASGLVGPDGQTPISSSTMGARQDLVPGRTGMGRDGGRQLGGIVTGGQAKQPATQPGALPNGAGPR